MDFPIRMGLLIAFFRGNRCDFPNYDILQSQKIVFVCLFDLMFYVPSTIFRLYRDGSSWIEPVLS